MRAGGSLSPHPRSSGCTAYFVSFVVIAEGRRCCGPRGVTGELFSGSLGDAIIGAV